MPVRTEQVQTQYRFDGKQALNEIGQIQVELKKAYRELGTLASSSNKAREKLEKMTDKESEAYKKTAQKLKEQSTKQAELSQTIDKQTTKLKQLIETEGLAALTNQKLRNYYTQLKRELRLLIDGTAEHTEKLKEFHRVGAALATSDAKLRPIKSAFDSIKSQFPAALAGGIAGGVVGLAAAGFSALGQAVASVIPPMKALADENSDLIIALGLSDDELDKLNNKLRKINTRTLVKDLKEIGVVAGDLNATNAELDGFIKSGDKLATVFNKDFGSAKETIELFGSLKGEFEELKNQRFDVTFEKLGSTVKVLNDAGKATSKGITEFLSRLGQLPNALKPSVTQLAAFAAVFEEANLTAEISSGGLSNILLVAAKNAEPFAKFLGLSVKEFKNLINTNPNQFLLELSERFKGLSATQAAETLQKMKIESQESIKVIGVLADNLEKVKDKQILASQAYAEGTRLTEVFNEKNNNFAGSIEKIEKAIGNFLANNSFTKNLKDLFVSFVDVLTKTAKTVEDVSFQYDNQASKVDNLKKTIVPLIDRYEVLSQKQNRTQSEQTELNNAISSISTVIPSAIGQVDRYGNALSINAQKAREFVEAQQRYLQTINAELIGGKRTQSFDAAKEIGKNTAEINRILKLPQNKAGDFVDTKITTPNSNAGIVITEDVIIPTSTIEKLRKRNADIKEEMLKLGRDIKFLRGELDPNADKKKEETDKIPSNKGLSDENDKLKADLETKAQLIADYARRRQLLAESEANREVLRAEQETEKTLAELKKQNLSKEEYANIEAVLLGELKEKVLAIRQKQYQEAEKLAKEAAEKARKLAEDTALAINEANIYAAEKTYDADLKLFEKLLHNKATKEKDLTQQRQKLGADLYTVLFRKNYELFLKQETESFDKSEAEKFLIAKKYDLLRQKLADDHANKLGELSEKQKEKAIGDAEQELKRKEQLREQYLNVTANIIAATVDLFKVGYEREEAEAQKTYDRNTQALESSQKAGLISEDAYQAAKAQIEQNYTAETRAIKRKQAEADKFAAIAQATIQAALAIIKASPNIPLQIATGVISGLQIAKMIATPIPEFAQGGYTDQASPGGQLFKKPSSSALLAWVNEKGRERIVSNAELQNPIISQLIGMIDSITYGRPGFANGGYSDGYQPVTNNYYTNSSDNALAEAITRLNKRLDEPIQGVWQWQTFKSGYDQINEIQNAAYVSK